MNHPRLFSMLALILLLSGPSMALWSPVPATDTLWKHVPGANVLLVRTGDARIDDGIEEGFRQSWSGSTWSWVPDSGIAAVAEDSVVLVFRLIENWSPVRASREEDCHKLSGMAAKACRDDQARAVFALGITGKGMGFRSGQWLLAEPSQVRQLPHGDAIAIDIVRDFALAVRAVRDSAYPAEGPLAGDRAWARETIVRSRRERARKDTLWVPREFAGTLAETDASREFQAPVRFVAMDSLETMMGTARRGAYLEPGLRLAANRQLRVRELSSGELLLIDDAEPRMSVDTTLAKSDLARLSHRAAGEERRMSWMVSVGYEASIADLMGFTYVAGYEFRRGLWGMLGWSKMEYGEGGTNGSTQGVGIVGVRFAPFLGWERSFLGPRMVVGARWWQPLGSGEEADDGRILDLAPRMTFDLDCLARYWYIGVSLETWLDDNSYEASGDDLADKAEASRMENGGYSFRAGLQIGFSDWRPAPPWRSAKEKVASATR